MPNLQLMVKFKGRKIFRLLILFSSFQIMSIDVAFAYLLV
jgi:hypothetical protein